MSENIKQIKVPAECDDDDVKHLEVSAQIVAILKCNDLRKREAQAILTTVGAMIEVNPEQF